MAENKTVLIYLFKRYSVQVALASAALCLFATPMCVYSQEEALLEVAVVTRGIDVTPSVGPMYSPPALDEPLAPPPVGGLTIVPTYDAVANGGINAATQTAINNIIANYQSIFSNNLTIHIYFYNMASGLGSSTFFIYNTSYSSVRNALASHATSSDDATALANTPSGSANPINGGTTLPVKPANGLALGLGTPELDHTFSGSPCPGFVGSGCIGINVSLANSIGDLNAVVQHEIDEILGLGSALSGTTTSGSPWPEDLFRWASAGVRGYAADSHTGNPCASGTPSAFFSINGGATNLNQFNNCNNGGDYGDWITHTPSHIQDAFTNGTGNPTLTKTLSEARALDVLGYTISSSKKIHSQITSF